jgi:preprotein translocase subunit SecY
MITAFLNIAKIPELKRKVLFTLFMVIVIYRLGAHVPTPFIDPDEVKKFFGDAFGGKGVFAVVNMFSGGAFSQMTIFALGIMPYISASIIIQLMTAVWPPLEKIAKEGESGRKKITQWTRYGTVGLSLFQGFGLGVYLYTSGLSMIDSKLAFYTITAMTMCTGTCFLMWMGEKISEHGIGNGISLIITMGIISAYPGSVSVAYAALKSLTLTPIKFISVFVVGIMVSALIIFQQQANRKVPVQHARRQVGRKMMQGGSTFIPLKLNTANVIPVIFSSAILTFPAYVLPGLGNVGATINDWITLGSPHNLYNYFYEMKGVGNLVKGGGIFSLLEVINLYTLAYIVLTAFFCFFYTAITLNPVDLADNLKKSGAFVPGVKPGKHTADYIDHILVRITVVGASLLIAVALVPDVLLVSFDIPYGFAQVAGGTGLIIVVGVLLDTMKQIDSQLLMRHYEGFSGIGGSGRSSSTRGRGSGGGRMKLR